MALLIGVRGSTFSDKLKDPSLVDDESIYVAVHTRKDRADMLVNLTDKGERILIKDHFASVDDWEATFRD